MGKKLDEHLNFNADLQRYGKLIFKYSENIEEHSLGKDSKYIGEWSEKSNRPHGRGIHIVPTVHTTIGYWENGTAAAGNSAVIYSGGDFEVTEWYKRAGKVKKRITRYKVDGTTKIYGE